MSIADKMKKFDAFDTELKLGQKVEIMTTGWIVRHYSGDTYVVAKNEKALQEHEKQR